MSDCGHHIEDDPRGMVCVLKAHPLNPDGHVYADPRGSDLNDRHGEQGHG